MRYYHVSKLISLLQTMKFMIVVKFPFDNIVSLYCAYIFSTCKLSINYWYCSPAKIPDSTLYIKFGKSQLFRNKTCFCPAVLFKALTTPSEDGFFFIVKQILCAKITDICDKENLNTGLFQYREKETWHPLTNRRITTRYRKNDDRTEVVLVTLFVRNG